MNYLNLEFIEIEEEEGDKMTAILLRMIEALVQYRTNRGDLVTYVKLIKLDKEKTEYLR